MSILCRLGFHDWETWTIEKCLVQVTTLFFAHSITEGYQHTRTCKKCKEFQSKLTTS